MRSAGHGTKHSLSASLAPLALLGLAVGLGGCQQQYVVENRYLSEATGLSAAERKQTAIQVEPAEAYAGNTRPEKVATKYVMFPSLTPEPSVPSPEGYSSVSGPNYAKSRKVGVGLLIPGALLLIGGIVGSVALSGPSGADDCGTVTTGMTDTCTNNRLLGLGIGVPLILGGVGMLVPGIVLTGTGFSGRDVIPPGKPNLRYVPSEATPPPSPTEIPKPAETSPTPEQTPGATTAPATTSTPATTQAPATQAPSP